MSKKIKIDRLGKFAIPKEIRKMLGSGTSEHVRFFLEKDKAHVSIAGYPQGELVGSRQVDKNGRVTIPISIRKRLELDGKYISLKLTTDGFTLKRIEFCYICNGEQNLHEYNGSKICEQCIKNIQKIL